MANGNIIFIDNERKYKFRIGNVVKIGTRIYKITNIEPLIHKESCGAITTTGTKDFDSYLKPREGYLYFIEYVAIDGRCEFQFQYPKGQPHYTPRGYQEYIGFDRANIDDPLYAPFIVINPEYPSVYLYNPTGVANTSYMTFEGEKFEVTEVTENAPPIDMEICDYPRSGSLGTA